MKRIILLSALAVVAMSPLAFAEVAAVQQNGYGPNPYLPEPDKDIIPTVNTAKAVGWQGNQTPVAAEGLKVNAFARDLDHPRWIYVLPNGDVLVAETNKPEKNPDGVKSLVMGLVQKRAGAGAESANRITLLRDTDNNGVADLRFPFLENLRSPFGMVLVGDTFYVANTDSVVAYPYAGGETSIKIVGKKLAELPAGDINHHWTKNLVASADGRFLYASIGSNSNVGENGMVSEYQRAAILEIDRNTGNTRVFASGLRNPVGMDWNPATGELWTAVNERDELGNGLVPDYMTSVKDGAFYGWPYSYYGQIVDERMKPQQPDLVAKAIKPDYALGSHTASLGLTFSKGDLLPPHLKNGVFVGQHGSWNADPRAGYKVIFVPFQDGKPNGMPIDVLTGFINDEDDIAYGRPVGVTIDKAGALLVADDVGNVIWRVAPQ